MNFYKRFIGDIQAKTGGLTLAEFGAYDRLLDHYYSTEVPIPAKDIYRICRAMSGSERAAVDRVLERFFDLTATGYAQSKADEVIAKALPLIEAARENGKKGGRPKQPKTQNEPSGLPGQAEGKREHVQNDQKKSEKKSENCDAPSDQNGDVSTAPDSNEINGLGGNKEPTGFLKETQEKPSLKATQSQSQSSSSDEEEKTKPARKRGAAAQLVSVDQLVAEGVSQQHAEDWMAARAKKSLPLTRTAWDDVKAEAGKAGMSAAEAVKTAAGNSWAGFKAKWIEPEGRGQHSRSAPVNKHAAAARAIWGDPNQPDYIDAETH